MFRQEQTYWGGWQEKTLDAMRRRRFDQRIAQLTMLGEGRIENLSSVLFSRKLEVCWQEIVRKPMRAQQETEVLRAVLGSVEQHADCLSRDEHDLVERALILGGCVPIEDHAEMDAASALSLRLWAHVGLVSGKPYIELEPALLHAIAKAFARAEHDEIRARFDDFHERLGAALYREGILDDKLPQKEILRSVLCVPDEDESALLLARRFLWASYDCMDYEGGVLLVHSALAEPLRMLPQGKKVHTARFVQTDLDGHDILPEEVPLEKNLERTLDGVIRNGYRTDEVVRTIRFLCKQGAPLSAMEDVLQASIIVHLTESMRRALADMYTQMPKWIECSERLLLQ